MSNLRGGSTVGGRPILGKEARDNYIGKIVGNRLKESLIYDDGSKVSLSGNLEFDSQSALLALSGGDTSSKNRLVIGEQHKFGLGLEWDSSRTVNLLEFDNTDVSGSPTRTIGSINVNTGLFNWTGDIQASGKLYYSDEDTDTRYLKVGAKAVNSEKLDNLDSSQFLRSDVDDTLNGNLTIGSNFIYGGSTARYLEMNGDTVLSNPANITIHADSDNSSSTEYLSLKAGSDDLRVTSGGEFTFNGNTVWNSGNFTPSDKADSSTLSSHTGNTNIHQDWGLWSTNGTQDLLGRGKRALVATTTNLVVNYSGDFSEVQVQSNLKADTIYQNGTTLDTQYLGINAKADDSNNLDGLNSTQFLRSDTNDTIDAGTNTTLTILSNDSGKSEIALYGDSQGTGRVYVGQSTTHGGGIEYNGDNTPVTSGGGSDYTTLYRRSNSIDYWTAKNHHSDNNWTFRGEIFALGGQQVYHEGHKPSWTEVTSKPSTFTPSSHTHSISEVTSLQTSLDGKLDSNAKASDSNLLDGLDSSQFLRADASDTHNGTLTISGQINSNKFGARGTEMLIGAGEAISWMNGNATGETVWIGGEAGVKILSFPDNGSGGWASRHETTLIDNSGNSTFGGSINAVGGFQWNGQSLDSRYLGASAKASDSDKLDNLNSSQFLRSDVDDSMSGNLKFTSSMKGIHFHNPAWNDAGGVRYQYTDNDGYMEFWTSDDYDEHFVFNSYDTGTDGSGTKVEWMKVNNTNITYKGNGVWHSGNFTPSSKLGASSKAVDSDKLDGISSSGFARKDARSDGYHWFRRSSSSSPLFVTQQSTGYIAEFRQGAGDGTAVAWIENNGSYNAGGNNINGFSHLVGNNGEVIKSTDSWLRINEDNSHTSGTYFGSSLVRTDDEFQVGSSGVTFKVSSSAFTYKGSNVYHEGHKPSWGEVTGKPSTFTPSSHSHSISDVTNLQSSLDGKLNTGAKASDSNLLDGINSSQFVRSDIGDTLGGSLMFSGHYHGIYFNRVHEDVTGVSGAWSFVRQDENSGGNLQLGADATIEFFETDSMNNFMTIDTNSGNMSIDGDVTVGNKADIEFINIGSSRYFADNSQTGLWGLNLNNSDIIGANAIMFNDTTDALNEGLMFPSDNLTNDKDYDDYNLFRITGDGTAVFRINADDAFQFYTVESFEHAIIHFGKTIMKSLNGSAQGLQIRNESDTDYAVVQASEFTVSSTRESKENIELFEDNALQMVRDTNIYTYNRKSEDDRKVHVGMIYDEAPEVLKRDDTLDLYSMTGMLWKSVQQSDSEKEQMKKENNQMKKQLSDLNKKVEMLMEQMSN